MKDNSQILPGFDLAAIVSKSDDISDLSDDKRYTAEKLLVSHPDRYNIARALFFELGLSKRAICELCKLNSRTLNALIERELNTRGADFLYERIRRKKALIAYQLTEQLEELSHDPQACKQAGINGLLQAIKLIQESAGKTIDVEQTSSSTFESDPSSIEYARIYKLTDSKRNGLESQKNLAPCVERSNDGNGNVSSVENHEGAVDKTAPSDDSHSILLSDDYHCLHGFSTCVDNSVDKRTSGSCIDESDRNSRSGCSDEKTPGPGENGHP